MTEYNPEDYNSRSALAIELHRLFEKCEFSLEKQERGREKVFSRKINDKIKVAVYSTIDGRQVRSVGRDAIRVVATYKSRDGKEKGIVKQKRINRTGEIEEIINRVHERMRETWKKASRPKPCRKCGAPLFVAKSGNEVCAEICWVKKDAE